MFDNIMHRVKNISVVLCFLLFGAGIAHSQEMRTEFRVDFRLGSAAVEAAFSDNAQQLSAIIEFLHRIGNDPAIEIVNVSFCGTTSPEGSAQLNRRLSQKRLSALEQLIRGNVYIPDELIVRDDYYIPWRDLKIGVEDSDMPQKEAIIAIIDECSDARQDATTDEIIQRLRGLDNGRAWQLLSKNFFADMRSASAVITTFRKEEAEPQPVEAAAAEQPEEIPVAEAVPDTPAREEAPVQELPVQTETVAEPLLSAPAESFMPKIYVKTNAAGWALLMANLAAEADLCEHLSFSLPIYYSGTNYFKYTIRFRIFGLQPEFRYWLSPANDGFFAGAHFGVAWYDFAFDGPVRYQDHERHTPALGGGINVGYRMPISRDKRWKVEFAVGGGVYRLHYDTFINEPNGKRAGVFRKTYAGLDQAAISFAYTFDRKKGGKR